MVKSQEAFNFYSHLAGMIAAVVGTIFLVNLATGSASMLATALIYGLSVTFLFSASSLYHMFKKQENELSFWRKMDRLAIFFMIAGSYTPICYFFLDENWRLPMIAIQWGLVAFGVCSQLFFPRAPRMIYAVIFLIMGWMLVFPMQHVLSIMTSEQATLLFAGGIAFTIGAIVYAIKKPLMLPGVFSFHELFHVMVLIGGACHYALIYSAFSGAAVA
ncbi:PAQR family membrane homeostasis protein TrhA [Alkalimarinus sediminis]|uniref:Hemolysin III family protein n=1 Tax=Alkalimarinus sediminis TaxID=1632866 RepID=A0A9E8HGU4_9ALTE|nr:hemolysin III family protein [Alkalimarinus sediminis]UZW74413.1 hemolysin III family protein [Alkalimarinus sediminis]